MTDPHLLGPDLTPTPFTADEIRQGCPPGRFIRLRVEAAGEAPYERLNRFVDCDEEGATIERSSIGSDGRVVEQQGGRTTWAALQSHAAFPMAQTSVASDALDTPMGRLDCLRYTVVDGSQTETFWFAMSKPGMPVRVVTERKGHFLVSTTMVADGLTDESP